MNTWICLLAVLGPVAHIFSAWLAARNLAASTYLRLSRVVGIVAVVSCTIPVLAVFAAGAGGSAEWTYQGLGFGILLDRLSVTFAVVIGGLGFMVLDYSRRYLSGEPSLVSFIGRLHLTLGLVTLLSYTGNLLQLVLLWSLTSLALHRLLFFYRERPKVVRSAARKFRMARTGDVLLAVACLVLYARYGTGSLAEIADRASVEGAAGSTITIAGLALVLAASLKSGQVPNHVWLPDVIEAPTPVSALLHAGIVNGGGFLMLRFADVVSASWLPSAVLLLIGGVSALWGSLVMLTKSSVKEALAYSTVSQMGLMMFECALGAYELALLHIVAHSAYKAHAFLGAGELSASRSRAPSADSAGKFALRWGFSAAVLVVGEKLLHGDLGNVRMGSWILLLIVASAMALVSSPKVAVLPARRRAARWLAALVLMGGLGCGYLLVEYAAEHLWVGMSANLRPLGTVRGGLGFLFGLVFVALALAQSLQLHRLPHRAVQRAYVHLKQDADARRWFERCWGLSRGTRDTASANRVLVTNDAYQQS